MQMTFEYSRFLALYALNPRNCIRENNIVAQTTAKAQDKFQVFESGLSSGTFFPTRLTFLREIKQLRDTWVSRARISRIVMLTGCLIPQFFRRFFCRRH